MLESTTPSLSASASMTSLLTIPLPWNTLVGGEGTLATLAGCRKPATGVLAADLVGRVTLVDLNARRAVDIPEDVLTRLSDS